MGSPEYSIEPDLPRTDVVLDLQWWTRKAFDELIFSEPGQFDEWGAIQAIQSRYGVEAPADYDNFWRLLDRADAVAQYEGRGLAPGAELELAIAAITYEDKSGEAEALHD